MTGGRRILVVTPAWAGDLVMAGPLMHALSASGAEVDALCPPHLEPLLARLPGVAATITLAVGHGRLGLAHRWRTARSLRKRYHEAYVLPNSWKSALVPALAGIPRRIGYVGEFRHGLLNDARVLDGKRHHRMVDRYLALARPDLAPDTAPAPRLVPDLAAAQRVLATLGLGLPDTPVLALCPGAEYGPAKRWPPASFAAVARHALAAGWAVWLIGSPSEREAAASVQAALPRPALDLTGRTTLGEAVDLLALTTAVVTNDSGLMHIAAALDKPQVAVFGSSDPEHTPPLSPRARVLSLKLACHPCFERVCPLGHTACLRDLAPDQAIGALHALFPDFAVTPS